MTLGPAILASLPSVYQQLGSNLRMWFLSGPSAWKALVWPKHKVASLTALRSVHIVYLPKRSSQPATVKQFLTIFYSPYHALFFFRAFITISIWTKCIKIESRDLIYCFIPIPKIMPFIYRPSRRNPCWINKYIN